MIAELTQWIIVLTVCAGVWIGETSLLVKLWHNKGRPQFRWLFMFKTLPALLPVARVIFAFVQKYPIDPSIPWWGFGTLFLLGFALGVTIMPGFVAFERWFRATWKKHEAVRLTRGLTTEHNVDGLAIAIVAIIVFIAGAFGYFIPPDLQPHLIAVIALILAIAIGKF